MSLKQKLLNRAFIAMQHTIPQHLLSRLVGKAAATRQHVIKNALIHWFHNKFDIDMSLAKQPDLTQYATFNDFFTRELKAGVRPIDADPKRIVCPADGAISQIGHITAGDIFQAKGQSYTVNQLIGDEQLAAPFHNGQFATVYLSPRDYHRVHVPFAGKLTDTLYIPGQLFSVNQVTAEHVPALFARNERMVCLFDTVIGRMAVVLVGAVIVAGIETVATGKAQPNGQIQRQQHQFQFNKGDELGRFYLGSTAIVLFEQNRMAWGDQFEATTVVRMGEMLGTVQ